MANSSVAVVGGGPAGLIAAEIMALAGLQVTVYDQRRSLGRKFLLAGRGGLNITHSEDSDAFRSRYGAASSFLSDALDAFTAEDLRQWCASHEEPTFVGTSGRVFPTSFRATPLLRSWLRRLTELGVAVRTRHRWTGWTDTGALAFETIDGTRAVAPDAVVFALGGASWPRVGGDGSWADLFDNAGIAVTELMPANCGVMVAWSDIMRQRCAGEPIKNAVFAIGGSSVRGDAVLTDTGLEGGPIYALGPQLRSTLPNILTIDTQPDITHDQLVARLSKRRPKASVSRWLSSAGINPLVVALARESTANALPQEPAALAALLKALPITITGLSGLERAISTAGGVRLDQIDHHFMVTDNPGVFVAGEMLDWEAPTGGYLLQGCFSTGVAAAAGVLAWLGRQAAS